MKKTLLVSLCLFAAFIMMACGTSGGSSGGGRTTSDGRAIAGGVPQFVREASRNAPEDALIGIGTARMASLGQSRTVATTRARAEISRQMNSMISDMITDYTAGSEVDHSAVVSYQENITTALSRSRLVGASVVDEDQDASGNYWVVVVMGKSNVVNEINQAHAQARLAVPAMAAMNAADRMEAAFDRAARQEVGFSNRD